MSVKNFGRPGQFLKVWKKIRNVREKISEKMYGKKSRGSKILATRGREDFMKFYLAPPKCVFPPKCPPPQIPTPGAATGGMGLFAKDLCLHQVSAIDINLKIFVSESNETKIQFQHKKT